LKGRKFIENFQSLPAEFQLKVQKLNTLSKQTKSLEQIYQKKIANLEELKKSILKKAFDGELLKK